MLLRLRGMRDVLACGRHASAHETGVSPTSRDYEKALRDSVSLDAPHVAKKAVPIRQQCHGANN
jgi:hypothetical protein